MTEDQYNAAVPVVSQLEAFRAKAQQIESAKAGKWDCILQFRDPETNEILDLTFSKDTLAKIAAWALDQAAPDYQLEIDDLTGQLSKI